MGQINRSLPSLLVLVSTHLLLLRGNTSLWGREYSEARDTSLTEGDSRPLGRSEGEESFGCVALPRIRLFERGLGPFGRCGGVGDSRRFAMVVVVLVDLGQEEVAG
jgi:hypothetical protein